jgi:hypothetical protein
MQHPRTIAAFGLTGLLFAGSLVGNAAGSYIGNPAPSGPVGGAPLDVAAPDFNPERADVTVDEDGTLEILALDADGEMVGALLAMPTPEHVQIDASFRDGYVSFVMVLDPAVPFVQDMRSDLPTSIAAERVTTLLSFVDAPTSGPFEATKRGCMLKFAAISMTCGAAIFFPGAQLAALGCAWAYIESLCECSAYLPLKIC